MEIKNKLNLDESNATLKEDITELDKAAIGTVMAALYDINEKEDEIKTEEKQIIENAYTQVLRDLIQDQFTNISHLESAIATFLGTAELEEAKVNSITSVLKELSDNAYVYIGMLQKAISEISETPDANMEAGEAVASEIIKREE